MSIKTTVYIVLQDPSLLLKASFFEMQNEKKTSKHFMTTIFIQINVLSIVNSCNKNKNIFKISTSYSRKSLRMPADEHRGKCFRWLGAANLNNVVRKISVCCSFPLVLQCTVLKLILAARIHGILDICWV